MLYKSFQKCGTFICPEVGINIERFGYPNWYKTRTHQTDEQLEKLGYKKSNHIDTEIVDLLLWQSNKNLWKCFEIKITYPDFKSKASKTFVGNYNYYIVPDNLTDKIKNQVPDNIGIYEYSLQKPQYRYERRLHCIKKAKKQELGCKLNEIYYGMIKSLYREMNKYKEKS